MPNAIELAGIELENYARLQRIKEASKEDNSVLDYEIKLSEAKLHSYGVSTEDLRK